MDLIAALITDAAQTGLLVYVAYKLYTSQPTVKAADDSQPTEEQKMIARAIVTHHMRGGGREKIRGVIERSQARRAERELRSVGGKA
jgi:hypothetical protein